MALPFKTNCPIADSVMTDDASTKGTFDSFRAVIGLWRSPGAMAAEIGASVASARKWEQRDRIPDEWWKPITESETGKAAGVTADLLADLASRKILPREPAEARP